MTSKQIFLTPAAGKRLIALALLQQDEVRRALETKTILIVAGTTNAYLAEALLASLGHTGFQKYRFFRGILRREAVPAALGQLEGDVVLRRGEWLRGQTIYDVADGMREGDLIFKGANAVNLRTGETAVLAGNPTSGTMGAIYRAVVGRRVQLITPVGVEKRVEQPIAELCRLCNAPGAAGLRLAPSPGRAYTELDAIRQLTGAVPHLIAAGGVCGLEGSALFQCEGTGEQLAALTQVLQRVGGTPRFSFSNVR